MTLTEGCSNTHEIIFNIIETCLLLIYVYYFDWDHRIAYGKADLLKVNLTWSGTGIWTPAGIHIPHRVPLYNASETINIFFYYRSPE